MFHIKDVSLVADKISRTWGRISEAMRWGILLFFLVLIPNSFSEVNWRKEVNGPAGFKYFIGIVGNPSVPDISWSDEELEQIKALGVNMVQLSIAWGGKPADEVLNLEDLNADQRRKFKFRIAQAQKHGLRTMAQFGIPRMVNFNPVRPACILDPEVQQKYQKLLKDFMVSFPEVNDVMVYTFDQQAWLCSEYGPCPRCSGIPLDERLPQFLNLLNDTMRSCRPGTTLW